MDFILQVKNLNVRFGAIAVIKDLTFEVKKGEVVAIIGPNGAGKTILFKTLLGTIRYEGEINWQKDIKIGYVPQKITIDKDLPLNIIEFLQFKNTPIEEIFEALESVGLDQDHFRHHFSKVRLGNLSGGELQRVLIAYALIGHPDILLFDEPTSGIDVGGEETIYTLLEKLNKKHNLTTLLISHDLNIIYQYADRVLCLNKRQICYGSPKEALSPEALENLYGSKIKLHQHDYK